MNVLDGGMQDYTGRERPDAPGMQRVVGQGHAPNGAQAQLLRKLSVGAHNLQQVCAPPQQRAPPLTLRCARMARRQQEKFRLQKSKALSEPPQEVRPQ
jgi:hypothetical protein